MYGEVKLTFSSYYKYMFTYVGMAPDGTKISASYGGDHDTIYRHSVSNNEVMKVGNVENEWHRVTAEKDGHEIFAYYDYN
jgi:hypothetical protein